MKHKMFMKAVEEFLSLIKYAEFVKANSYLWHDLVFNINGLLLFFPESSVIQKIENCYRF